MNHIIVAGQDFGELPVAGGTDVTSCRNGVAPDAAGTALKQTLEDSLATNDSKSGVEFDGSHHLFHAAMFFFWGGGGRVKLPEIVADVSPKMASAAISFEP